MNDKICKEIRNLTGHAVLFAAVSGDEFGTSVLDYVSKTATIRNFSVFYFADLTQPKGVQSVWSGQIGDYWLRRNGVSIADNPLLTDPILDSNSHGSRRWPYHRKVALYSSGPSHLDHV